MKNQEIKKNVELIYTKLLQATYKAAAAVSDTTEQYQKIRKRIGSMSLYQMKIFMLQRENNV